MSKLTQTHFKWQLNAKILLFTMIFFPLTVSLGFWQLERAEEKTALLALYMTRQQSAPIAFSQIEHQGDRQYLRVQLSGRPRVSPTLLLDNRVLSGKPGFDVLTIVDTELGPVLANRGWIAAGVSRENLPEIPSLHGADEAITLTGYLYQSPGKQVMLGEDNWNPAQQKVIIQNAAPDKVAERMGEPFYPYMLRLLDSKGGLRANWTIVNVLPEKHTGYAVQWFAMAVALVLLTLFANSNLSAVMSKNQQGKAAD